MNELIFAEKTEVAVTLQDVEYRLHRCRENIATSLYEIGCTLNEAKKYKLVGDEKWKDWVVQNTGLDVRSAQRYMAYAREIEPGSPVARISYTKALEIFKLPQAERDEMAERVERENMSLRELQKEIAQLKHEKELLQDQKRDQSVENFKLISERDQAVQDAKQSRKNKMKADRLGEELTEEKKKTEALQLKLQEALARPAVKVGISPEAQERIDELEDMLQAKSDELTELKRSGRAREMDDARGGVVALAPSVLDIGAAVKAFIGVAGILPQMGGQMRVARKADRQAVMSYVRQIEDWVKASKSALDCIEI